MTDRPRCRWPYWYLTPRWGWHVTIPRGPSRKPSTPVHRPRRPFARSTEEFPGHGWKAKAAGLGSARGSTRVRRGRPRPDTPGNTSPRHRLTGGDLHWARQTETGWHPAGLPHGPARRRGCRTVGRVRRTAKRRADPGTSSRPQTYPVG